MRNCRHLLVVSFLLITGNVISQAPQQKTLLWQVTGKGIQQPSYLFGTIHVMCPDDLAVPAVVKQKFDATKQLYLEIDMDDPAMMTQMMQQMRMKDSSTLQTLLGKDYDTTNAMFQKLSGISLQMLNTAKPFLLMSMLYPSILGCTPASWESVFQKMATDKHEEINGLEKLQDQMAVFDKIPYQMQADMLRKMLMNVDSMKIQFQQLLAVYKKKDLNELNLLTSKEEDFGEFQDILLTDRNKNWIPVITAQATYMPTFFAFGAGHLGGNAGVIALLRKAGYTVKPVMYN